MQGLCVGLRVGLHYLFSTGNFLSRKSVKFESYIDWLDMQSSITSKIHSCFRYFSVFKKQVNSSSTCHFAVNKNAIKANLNTATTGYWAIVLHPALERQVMYCSVILNWSRISSLGNKGDLVVSPSCISTMQLKSFALLGHSFCDMSFFSCLSLYFSFDRGLVQSYEFSEETLYESVIIITHTLITSVFSGLQDILSASEPLQANRNVQ